MAAKSKTATAKQSTGQKSAGQKSTGQKSTGQKSAGRKAASKSSGGAVDLGAVLSPAGLAQELAKAADALASGAEGNGLPSALEDNLELWVTIKTLAERQNGQLDGELRQALLRTADTVADTTLNVTAQSLARSLEWLITANLKLSQNLTSAVLAQMTRDHAYHLWQQAGSPSGDDQNFWFMAEREIQAALEGA